MTRETFTNPKYIVAFGLKTKVFCHDPKMGYGCDECCNGDRCDNPNHGSRMHCRHCKGKGWIPSSEVTSVSRDVKLIKK